MKNYDETINSVFDRIGEYESNKKRKRSAIIKGAVSLCCVCAVALVGVGVWQGTKPSNNTHTDPITSPSDHSVNVSLKEELDSDTIIFNEMSVKVPDLNQICGIALMLDDFVPMTKAELNEYYGVDVFSACPVGFTDSVEEIGGIFKRDKGTGKIYHDTNKILFTNADASKTIVVSVAKLIPLVEMSESLNAIFKELYSGTDSLINGVKVLMAEVNSENYYYARIFDRNTGAEFTIWSEGATKQEFLSVIYSLTDSLGE